MLTRSEGNLRRRGDAATQTIKLLERRLDTLELKQELTENDILSVLRLSKLFSDVSNDFKTYHFAIVDQLQDDKEAHQSKRFWMTMN